MERDFTDIEEQVEEIYDGFYEDARQMLERDIPSKVFCKKPQHETNPTDGDDRERVLFRFTAHTGEAIGDHERELRELQDNFHTDTRFSTLHKGTSYCIGVFPE